MFLSGTAAAEALRLSIPPEQTSNPIPGNMPLSLEDAVAMALENNRGLRAERLRPAIQGTFEAQEQARFDPVAFADLEVTRDRSVRQFQEIQVQETFRSERERAEAGLRQTLPTGTELTLSLRSDRAESSRTSEQFTGRAGLSLTQALLRGGRIASNLVRLRQAGLDVTASEYELRGFIETLVADVESAYWEVVLAAEEIAILEDALRVSERQLEETRGRIRAGDRPETEAIGARAEVALRRQGLIDARSALARSQDRLSRLIRTPGSDWDRGLNATSPAAPGTYELEPVAVYVALGRDYRSDLNETRLRLQRDDLEIVQTRNGMLPQLDFFLTLGGSGFADSFGASVRADEGDGYDLSAGLRFELPLGNRAAEAGFSRARLTRAQTREVLHNLEQLAIQDIRGAWFDADQSRAQVQAREETLALQEELLRVAEIRFRVGAGTGLEVAQAQRDLLESQLSLLAAKIRYRQARTDLLRQSGTLLLHRGIETPGQEPVPF
ncbi:TolC family protein [Thioalkalivibrio sp.]|uniref:TolC family protein n=1 Tax=Thioalkalivibrio sp. TaxID=2093813 RepID=UPI0039771658